jgi:hypothetical protein
MKTKLLLVLLFSVFSVVSTAQVIFDPATYPQDSLPAGMTLDTINGKVYVQIILNGWNSYIKIDPHVAINENATHFRVIAKYGAGVSGFELSKIKTFLKLVNPDYTELAAAANVSSDSLIYYQVKLAKIDQVGYIQVAGQETSGWTAVTGDTLWLGKVMAVKVDPQAIFDPDAYDPDLLLEGDSIVELDGVKYCRLILHDGSEYIPTFPFTIGDDTKYMRVKMKYGGGVSGIEQSKISGNIELYTSAPFVLLGGAATLAGNGASYKWTILRGPIYKGLVAYVDARFYEWGTFNSAITGDTVWIGKVRAITLEPKVVFDPAQYDPDELPAGMEIVNLGGTKYLQAVLNGWSSSIPVDPISATTLYSHVSTEVKYAVGSSGFPLNKINTFLKLATADWTELGAAGSASSAEFKKYSVAIPTQGIVANFQFAGQETTNWSAVTGDTLWIGKMIFEDLAAPTAPGNLTATVDTSKVTLAWDASTDNQYVKGYVVSLDDIVLDTVTVKTFEVPGLDDGTYTFSVVAIDGSGNFSTASTVEAIVFTALPNAVHSQSAERLKIYPNPVKTTLWVNRVQYILEINIINMTGTIVRTVHNTNTVDVTDLREGLYLIQVKTPSSIYSSTFVKE